MNAQKYLFPALALAGVAVLTIALANPPQADESQPAEELDKLEIALDAHIEGELNITRIPAEWIARPVLGAFGIKLPKGLYRLEVSSEPLSGRTYAGNIIITKSKDDTKVNTTLSLPYKFYDPDKLIDRIGDLGRLPGVPTIGKRKLEKGGTITISMDKNRDLAAEEKACEERAKKTGQSKEDCLKKKDETFTKYKDQIDGMFGVISENPSQIVDVVTSTKLAELVTFLMPPDPTKPDAVSPLANPELAKKITISKGSDPCPPSSNGNAKMCLEICLTLNRVTMVRDKEKLAKLVGALHALDPEKDQVQNNNRRRGRRNNKKQATKKEVLDQQKLFTELGPYIKNIDIVLTAAAAPASQ